jgi:transcription termination factor Rho
MPTKTSASDIVGKPVEETVKETPVKAAKVTAEEISPEVEQPVAEAVSTESASSEAVPAETKTVKDIPIEPVRPRRTLMSRSNDMGRDDNRGGRDNGRSNGRSRMMSNGGGMNRNRQSFNGVVDDRMIPDADATVENVTGFLDTSPDGHGVLRVRFSPSEGDAYISSSQIRRFRLRPGDVVTGPARAPKENERYWGLLKVDTVNGKLPEEIGERVKFQTLTPVYPDKQIKLETGDEPFSTRIIDMLAPIGKGQRSLIVAPPKAGKTTLLMQIATGIAANHPEMHIMAVLVGERPEEVTDFRRHIERITKGKGEVAASNFDESAEDQCRVAEIALERAKRLVEAGQDVVILLDSITRLAPAYNLSIPTSGRTLSGGFDPAALFPP